MADAADPPPDPAAPTAVAVPTAPSETADTAVVGGAEVVALDPPSSTLPAALPRKEVPRGGAAGKPRTVSRQLATQQALFKPSDPDTHKQSGVNPVNQKAMRVHPRGFKVLAPWSPMERQLTTYFRLPPLPPHRLREEGELVTRMHRLLQTSGDQRSPQTLDGFLLLEAAGVEDPGQAVDVLLADRNLTKVVAEDLTFFPNIEFLDVGENQVEMGSLANLTGLQELHLHCNQQMIVDVPPAAFPHLHTLNLSYNYLGPEVFESLTGLPRLQRLDLSHNHIAFLPEDLSGFDSLTQLALESNGIAAEETLLALGTIPGLMEVNLNFNALQRVPRLKPNAGTNLEVLGLASNKFEYYEDLFPLTEYPNLRRVVLWGNALQRNKHDLERLRKELAQLDVAVVLDGPLPPKKRAVDFYAKNRGRFVTVPPWTYWVQPPKPLKRKSPRAEDGPDGSTFFITGGGAFHHSEELSPESGEMELTASIQQSALPAHPTAAMGFFSDPPHDAAEDSLLPDGSMSADLSGLAGAGEAG
eukprot:EG_transcript_8873